MLKSEIKRIFVSSAENYGSDKITNELHRLDIQISRSYVSRLMRELGIKSRFRKKFVVTTNANYNYPVGDNLLERNFTINELGKIWVSDITFIKVSNSWAYFTTMIDLADRKVVGWSLSKDMTAENTVIRAWTNARNTRGLYDSFG